MPLPESVPQLHAIGPVSLELHRSWFDRQPSSLTPSLSTKICPLATSKTSSSNLLDLTLSMKYWIALLFDVAVKTNSTWSLFHCAWVQNKSGAAMAPQSALLIMTKP